MDQVVGHCRIAWKARDAETHRGMNGRFTRPHLETGGFHCLPQPFRDGDRFGKFGLWHRDSKFFAAKSRRDVVLASYGTNELSDRSKHHVARQMAVGVVDVPQQVEIRHDDCQGMRESFGAFHFRCKQLGKVSRIPKTGLGIRRGVLSQLRNHERAISKQQRRNGWKDQPGIDIPDDRDDIAQQRMNQVSLDILNIQIRYFVP